MPQERNEKAKSKRWILKKISDGAIITGVVIFTLLAGGLYWWWFRAYEWSKDPSDWADLATYISGTIGVFVVASTLVVLVRTLDKQRDLIDSQNTMLEKQERQLEQSEEIIRIERDKAKEVARRESKEADNAAVYMIHHFENLENMLSRLSDGFSPRNVEYFMAVHEKHPALYSSFLLEEDAEVIKLVNSLDVDLAKRCIGAIVNAKVVFSVIDYHVRRLPEGDRDLVKVRGVIRRIKPITRKNTLEAACAGLKDCRCFLAQARKLIG